MTGCRPAGIVLLLTCTAVFGACSSRQEPEAQSVGPPVEARAALDRAVATTGDVVTYTLEIEHDPAFEPRVPDLGERIADLQVIDRTEETVPAPGGREIERIRYRLRADLLGTFALPAVEVTYAPGHAEEPEAEFETTSTPELFLEVESVLPADDAELSDIRDLKPVRRPSRAVPIWLVSLSLGLLLLGALLVYWLLRRQMGGLRERPEVPAHRRALLELERLRTTDFKDLDALRAYYFDLSHVVRRYVEERFRWNVTDLTQEEIRAGIGDMPEFQSDDRDALLDFLAETDQVKFARVVPDSSEIETTWEKAIGFVERTAAVLADEEEATSPGADPSGEAHMLRASGGAS